MSWLTGIHGRLALSSREGRGSGLGREREAGGGTGKRRRREEGREGNCDWAGKN